MLNGAGNLRHFVLSIWGIMGFDAFVKREAQAVAGGGPFTIQQLTDDLRALGTHPGMTFIVHSSLSKIGWVVGGTQAACTALIAATGENGTVMMPAHSTHNSDPAFWQNPPIPESWWPVVRDHMPAYDPAITPTRGIGKIPELFRTFPGVKRSSHPVVSFTARGPHAETLLANHPLDDDIGEGSPIAHLYDLDGYVLLLGVGYGNNTAMHLAEYRANFSGKHRVTQSCAMLVHGIRQWVEYHPLQLDDEDFPQIGEAFEAAHPGAVRAGSIGKAHSKLIRVRPLIDFSIQWMEANRR